jgi:oligopeptide transport system ATP-binding protein
VTPTLAVDALSVHFGGRVAAVREASFQVQAAECLGIVGESGSGKTQVCLAAMGLLGAGARTGGSIRFEGEEILDRPAATLNRIRGSKLTMVFQDPMTSLTPHLRIGTQLAEVLVCHAGMSWREAEAGALRILDRMHIPEPQRRLRQYPHELSGGMRQRVMIGMSLLCEPSLLIADEPTTALDVTVQARIIDLLRNVRQDTRMGVVLISHDIAVVASLADRILVMYGGRVVEAGTTRTILDLALHPYTAALLRCVPDLRHARVERMPTLAGQAPSPASEELGCAFAPRCPRASERCRSERPLLSEQSAASHQVACHHPQSS